jgi:predicted transcriptional regulator
MSSRKEVKDQVVAGRVTGNLKKRFNLLCERLDRTESYMVELAVRELVGRKNGKRHG